MIKRPKVLILDEATSALDSKSESLINETLKNLTNEGSMTIISIAHRLSTISKSVCCCASKHGQVVETGKFVELFSNPDSELSKLLDESATSQAADRQEEEENYNKRIVIKLKKMNESILIEAEEIENEQIKYSKAKNLIESLPLDMKQQLLTEINIEEKHAD